MPNKFKANACGAASCGCSKPLTEEQTKELAKIQQTRKLFEGKDESIFDESNKADKTIAEVS